MIPVGAISTAPRPVANKKASNRMHPNIHRIAVARRLRLETRADSPAAVVLTVI